jgi:hypothetical protein
MPPLAVDMEQFERRLREPELTLTPDESAFLDDFEAYLGR